MMKEVVHFADEKTSMDFDRNYYRTILPIPQKKLMLILILYKHQNI